MAWSDTRARQRIEGFMKSAPAADIVVEDFAPYFERRSTSQQTVRRLGQPLPAEPVWFVPRNRAITTHGVHVYANLMDYNDKLVEDGSETERSHRQALQFLHLHYVSCDQLIVAFGIQRVDFHGSRLHAVVLNPTGLENERERVSRALAFAAAFREMVARTSGRYGAGFGTRVRVGVDSGPAVAVNSGRKDEHEPLFIGSPANHAAKLADGDDPGVYVSPRVHELRQGLRKSADFVSRMAIDEEAAALDETFGAGGGRQRLEEAFSAVVADREALAKAHGGEPRAVFNFHEHNPPLRTIEFVEHPPSNAIRMPLASIFADIDGFTAYVDAAMVSGTVAQAVANLHVLRGEMAAVLREDFGGRKVRFIGDCLHGIIAEGTANNIDEAQTVRSAVLALAGIRSSFDLCRLMLPGISGLGIAIGVELGVTPACRIGLRGEGSVRCSSSLATCLSEAEQKRCTGEETALGEEAYSSAEPILRRVFGADRIVRGLGYVNATLLLGALQPQAVSRPDAAAQTTASPSGRREMRAHQQEPMRAHFRLS